MEKEIILRHANQTQIRNYNYTHTHFTPLGVSNSFITTTSERLMFTRVKENLGEF